MSELDFDYDFSADLTSELFEQSGFKVDDDDDFIKSLVSESAGDKRAAPSSSSSSAAAASSSAAGSPKDDSYQKMLDELFGDMKNNAPKIRYPTMLQNIQRIRFALSVVCGSVGLLNRLVNKIIKKDASVSPYMNNTRVSLLNSVYSVLNAITSFECVWLEHKKAIESLFSGVNGNIHQMFKGTLTFLNHLRSEIGVIRQSIYVFRDNIYKIYWEGEQALVTYLSRNRTMGQLNKQQQRFEILLKQTDSKLEEAQSFFMPPPPGPPAVSGFLELPWCRR